jgi:hypothetical protein
MLVHYQALEDMFTVDQVSALFEDIGPVDYLNNRTRNAITTAVDLLSDTALEHIAIVDGGVEADYDTHNAAAVGEPEEIQNGNIWNVCDALASCTTSLLENGIAVLIHSEFGRRENDSANTGTEHHPRGYVNVVISDLIGDQLLVGDAVVGPNEPAGSPAAFATYETAPGDDPQPLTPTDVHAAMLQVAGIDPIASDLLDDDLKRLPGANAAIDLLGIS